MENSVFSLVITVLGLILTILSCSTESLSNIKSTDSREKNTINHHIIKRDLFYYAHANYVRNDDNIFPYNITCMLTIQGDGGDAEPGDVYFGTPQGLFFRTNGQNNRRNGNYDTKKINSVEGSVHLLCEHQNGAIIASTYDNHLYYIDNNHNVKEDFDVADPITTIITIKKDGFESKAGDVYFGTSNGVYLRRVGSTAYKIRGINGYVTIIQEHLDGTVHIVLGEPREKIIEKEKNDIIKSLNDRISKLELEKSSMNNTFDEEREKFNQTIQNCQNEKSLTLNMFQALDRLKNILEEDKREFNNTLTELHSKKLSCENENTRLGNDFKKCMDISSSQQSECNSSRNTIALQEQLKRLSDRYSNLITEKTRLELMCRDRE